MLWFARRRTFVAIVVAAAVAVRIGVGIEIVVRITAAAVRTVIDRAGSTGSANAPGKQPEVFQPVTREVRQWSCAVS